MVTPFPLEAWPRTANYKENHQDHCLGARRELSPPRTPLKGMAQGGAQRTHFPQHAAAGTRRTRFRDTKWPTLLQLLPPLILAERKHKQWEWKREKQTPRGAGSLMQGSIVGLRDHDLSRSLMILS